MTTDADKTLETNRTDAEPEVETSASPCADFAPWMPQIGEYARHNATGAPGIVTGFDHDRELVSLDFGPKFSTLNGYPHHLTSISRGHRVEQTIDGVVRAGTLTNDPRTGKERFLFASDVAGRVCLEDIRARAPRTEPTDAVQALQGPSGPIVPIVDDPLGPPRAVHQGPVVIADRPSSVATAALADESSSTSVAVEIPVERAAELDALAAGAEAPADPDAAQPTPTTSSAEEPSTFKCHKCGVDLGYWVNLMRKMENDDCHESTVGCWKPECRAINIIDADRDVLIKPSLAAAVAFRKHCGPAAQRIPTGIPTLDRVFGETQQNQTAGLRPGLVYLLTGNVEGTDLYDLGMQIALPTRLDGPLVYIGLERDRDAELADMAARGVREIGDGLVVATAKHMSHVAALLKVAQKRLPFVVVVDLTWNKSPLGVLGSEAVARALAETAQASFATVIVLLPHRRDAQEAMLQQGTDVVVGLFKPFVDAGDDALNKSRLASCLKDRQDKPGRDSILERPLDGTLRYVEASDATIAEARRLWDGHWPADEAPTPAATPPEEPMPTTTVAEVPVAAPTMVPEP